MQWWYKKHGNKSDRNFTGKLKYMHCYIVSVLNIGLFQFSSKISVTLVSVLFTPPLVNPTLSLENVFIYLLILRVNKMYHKTTKSCPLNAILKLCMEECGGLGTHTTRRRATSKGLDTRPGKPSGVLTRHVFSCEVWAAYL